MAKTPIQMIDLFRQFADQNCVAANVAIKGGDKELAAQNVGNAIKSRLMEGMITWRLNVGSPAAIFRRSLEFTRRLLPMIKTESDANPMVNSNLNLSKANFMARLLDEASVGDDANGMEGDLLLDCVLANGLYDRWDADLWAKGNKQLQRHKGTDLAITTYALYHDILHSTDIDSVKVAIAAAVGNFVKRKSNPFFAGGDQINGGGLDNGHTVDYRLSALLKKRGLKSNTFHDWIWDCN
jgi:hypothetical protein